MSRILVVDDDPGARQTIRQFLDDGSHQLSEAVSGEQALEMVGRAMPDLVLLDVMLPGMHGFEVARRLKTLVAPRFLPIMLITALTDQSSRVLGFRSGVDDCLGKPFDRIELRARVDNLLQRGTVSEAIALKNAELVEQQHFKEELATMVVHDLKNPLAVVLSNIDFALESLPPGTDEAVVGAIHDSRLAAQRILRMVGNLLDVARMEANRLQLVREPVDLCELLGNVLRLRATLAHTLGVRCRIDCAPATMAPLDADMISRVIENVLDNALRYTPSGGRLELSVRAEGDRLQVRIGNTGPAIPRELHATIFEKFGQVKGGRRLNLGLGMYFCRLAAEAHGGRMWIEEEPELPAVFVLELPTA